MVEGFFAERRDCWGLSYDTSIPNVGIPEGRILKGAHLFSDSIYDEGNEEPVLGEWHEMVGKHPACSGKVCQSTEELFETIRDTMIQLYS